MFRIYAWRQQAIETFRLMHVDRGLLKYFSIKWRQPSIAMFRIYAWRQRVTEIFFHLNGDSQVLQCLEFMHGDSGLLKYFFI